MALNTKILHWPEKDFSTFESAIELRREHPDRGVVYEEEAPVALVVHGGEGREELIVSAAQYGQLRYLNLAETKLKALRFDGEFPHLELLDLSNMGLEEITLPNGGFPALRQLYLQGNKLSQINFSGHYPKLELLDLSGNALEQLQLSAPFDALKYLYLYQNQSLKRFTFSRLPALRVLDLEGASLEQLPDNFLRLQALETLYLNGNPLKDIPREVLGSGKRHDAAKDVLTYLEGIRGGRGVPLHQAKLLLIGNGMVGKSSIVNKLIDKEAPLIAKEDRTEVIAVIPYDVNIPPEETGLDKPIDYHLRIWDFGGQDKYREVQQLFCSPRSLYVYVTSHDDTDKEHYSGYKYWLLMARAYGRDGEAGNRESPVLFVVNKIDEETRALNEVEIKSLFPNVKEFHRISANTLDGFDAFEKAIRKTIAHISEGIFTDEFPMEMLEVKEALEARAQKVDYLYFDDYFELYKKTTRLSESLSPEETEEHEGKARSWLRVLGRIGSILYFGEHRTLKDWIVLNPEWVRKAFSQVIEAALADWRYGVVQEKELFEIWKEYEESEQEKFKLLLTQYKLAYETTNELGDVVFVFPSALPEKRADQRLGLPEGVNPCCELRLCFDPFLPAGTMSRLIVTLLRSNNVYERKMWRGNAVFHIGYRSFAHLRENWTDKQVEITLYGENPGQIFRLVESKLQSNLEELKKTTLRTQLDFHVEGKFKNGWYDVDVLKSIGDSRYSFLWEEIPGEGKEVVEGEKPVEAAEEEGVIWSFEQRMNILFVSSNPKGTSKINSDQEDLKIRRNVECNKNIRVISSKVQQATIKAMKRAIYEENPTVIHFSGHGVKAKREGWQGEFEEAMGFTGGLVFYDEDLRESEVLDVNEAYRLFEDAKKVLRASIRLVFLNSCFSSNLAEEISKLDIYVIGSTDVIGDEAARKFSTEVYRKIAEADKLTEEVLVDAIISGVFMAGNHLRQHVSLFYRGKKIELFDQKTM